ncbi:MAG: hypothetical protein IPJ94_12550 [Chloroflexi bacterium]|nr:hypothetical protein [Chloroflexota bacterium]
MILLNFAHPLSLDQLAQIEALTGQTISQTVEVPSQVQVQDLLPPQITRLVDAALLTPAQWQNEAILVNPPALNFSAVLLVAECHGRMGYFPACVRLKPVPDSLPPRFEVAEILNLQAVRDAARKQR